MSGCQVGAASFGPGVTVQMEGTGDHAARPLSQRIAAHSLCHPVLPSGALVHCHCVIQCFKLNLKPNLILYLSCGILVPQPEIEPTSSALEAQSLNCWTAREVPWILDFNVKYPHFKCSVIWAFELVTQLVRNLPAMQDIQVWSLSGEDPPQKRKWQSTPGFLPGEFHGQKSLKNYSPWRLRVGHDLTSKPPLGISRTWPACLQSIIQLSSESVACLFFMHLYQSQHHRLCCAQSWQSGKV